MKFLDLNTGYSFDALWKSNQSKGYTFWFPNEQSIDITYSMPICIITKKSDPIKLRIEDNNIFKFINHTKVKTEVDGYLFDSPEYSLEIITVPEQVGSYYAHLFNVAGVSKNEGEFICRINIGDEGFIRVGADFYGEYEPAYINLSNMGVEIPEAIQKAVYNSDVHEDLKDNILLNRKFKELLSNYWDIAANKGSYKSLLNSLEWFEWGNLLNIKEIWKRDEAGRIMFNDKDIIAVFQDRLSKTFENSIKTTYISLYCALQEELDVYDVEGNPILKDVVFKWTKNDLQLKISLLAQFFGAFFLPIHISILHATVEDKVFTNTIKAICGADIKQIDLFGEFEYIECNIKDNDVFRLDNVRAQASENTLFAVKDIAGVSFGVDKFPTNGFEGDYKMFFEQYYTGPGAIIPINLKIHNQLNDDFIKKTIVNFKPKNNSEEIRLEFSSIIYAKDNKFDINFNFLAKEAMNYDIKLTFITGTSKTISRSIKFTVEDVDNINLNIYKVQAKNDCKGFTYKDFYDRSCNKYFTGIQNINNESRLYWQYLPYMDVNNSLYKNYKGIKLSRTVVIEITKDMCDFDIFIVRCIMLNDYLEFAKYDKDGKITYLIFVSKRFNAKLPKKIILNGYKVIRNELGFYPQFHKLKKIEGNNINDYTVSQYEAICVAPEINHGPNKIMDFKYGHLISDCEWKFMNSSNGKEIFGPITSRQPFIAQNIENVDQGYYDILFKYRLNDETKECKLKSAFRIKYI